MCGPIDVVQVQAADRLHAQVVGGPGHADVAAEARVIAFVTRAVELGHDVTREGFVRTRSGRPPPLRAPAQGRVLALEGPGDERLVPAAAIGGKGRDRVVLPFTYEIEVVDAIGHALDVAEHHGGRGVHSQLVGHAHGRQPGLGVALADADLAAHGRGEDLASAAGDGVEAGFPHLPHDAPQLRF
jgi:hypothetical protein